MTKQVHSRKRTSGTKTVQKRPEFFIRCSPRRFGRLLDSLDEAKRSAIAEIGFGGLLDIKCRTIPYKLCISLVKNFDPEGCQLKIVVNEVLPITSRDIALTFGIPENGTLPDTGISQNIGGRLIYFCCY